MQCAHVGVTFTLAAPRKLFENFVYKLSGVWSVNFALISCRFEGVSARERGLNPRGVAYGAVTCLYSALAPSAAAAIAHIKQFSSCLIVSTTRGTD